MYESGPVHTGLQADGGGRVIWKGGNIYCRKASGRMGKDGNRVGNTADEQAGNENWDWLAL